MSRGIALDSAERHGEPRRARVHLVAGRERALLGGHPWVLSGSIAKLEGQPASGELVQVVASDGRSLGLGDYDPSSQIRVRMLSSPPEPVGLAGDWLESRLEEAIVSRERSPLLQSTNAVRWVHAEADALPGLTIDRFGQWAVIKASTPAMLGRAEAIARWLSERCRLDGIWLRGEVRATELPQERALAGSVPEEPIEIYEGPRRYWVDLRRGQKTGFYLDQRDSRELFQQLARGRRSLDLYAYTGGFAVAAIAGGASEIVAVESSATARELLERNAPGCEIAADDVERFLQTDRRSYDLVSIDPPPFAKHKRDVDAACRAYRELHVRAFARAAGGADVLTFTCSHHVDSALFRKSVAVAARASGRRVQLLRVLGAPCDHPVALRHPEGEYLSGLWLRVGASQSPSR